MKVKDHYEKHLANFYSWMTGNFEEKLQEQLIFFNENRIGPMGNRVAIDLGAGHGLQSIALAQRGFLVKSVDFSKQLLQDLQERKSLLDLRIETFEDDILNFLENSKEPVELIVCMGDTLTHLETLGDVELLVSLAAGILIPEGKIIISFRDLTRELEHEQRFIQVRSDDDKILTCFLEYFSDHVVVHDILHEKTNEKWIQKVSAYPKLRLSEKMVTSIFEKKKMELVSSKEINRMIHLIAKKVS